MGQGFLGGFRGALGPVVGYCWRGRWCMRSRPVSVRNPRTEAQQRHRRMFKEEVQLAGRLNWVLRQTYGALSLEEHLTPCNHFVRVNQEAFGSEGGAFRVRWELLRLSEGTVSPVAFGAPVVTGGTTLTVDFEKNPCHGRADGYDRVYLVVYCPENGQCFLTAPVYRRMQRLSVVLPGFFAGREVQLWGLVQDRKGQWSDSIYIGYGPIEDNVPAEGGNLGNPGNEMGVEGMENLGNLENLGGDGGAYSSVSYASTEVHTPLGHTPPPL